MNTADLQVFNQAVQLANSGNKLQAHSQLKTLQPQNPIDPNLLMWLAFTSPSPYEAENYLNNLLMADPNNSNIPAIRGWLNEQKALMPVAPQPIRVQPPQPLRPPKVQSRRSFSPLLFGGIAVLVALVIAVVLFIRAQPAPLPADGEYVNYSSDRELITRSSVGQHVRVPATIDYVPPGDKEETFTLNGSYGLVDSGIILRIPDDNKRNVSFKTGKNVYFGLVTGRETIEGKPYLVIEVEQVK